MSDDRPSLFTPEPATKPPVIDFIEVDSMIDRLGARLTKQAEQIAELLAAGEITLAFLTNVNSYEPHEVAAAMVRAMANAGFDKDKLDDIAMAMLHGAAHA